jgi:hypothetical protein
MGEIGGQNFALCLPPHVKGTFYCVSKQRAATKNVLLDQCAVFLVNLTKYFSRHNIHLMIIFRISKGNKQNSIRIRFKSRK